MGNLEQVPSDTKLATLKSDAERGYVSVTTADIIALVECVECARRYRDVMDVLTGKRDWNVEQTAFDRLDEALEKLGMPAP